MRIQPATWTLLIAAILLAACGTPPSAPTPEVTPSALPANPPSDSASNNPSLPYGKNIRFEQLSLEDGLSQSVVNAILQDNKGFLWIGTDDGLNRYDGYEFKVYKPDTNDPDSLSDRSVTDLVEDSQGYLWIATRVGGLNRYDPVSGKFTTYMHDENDEQSIADNHISTLLLDRDGLWVGTGSGLDFFSFETNTFTHYPIADSSLKPVSPSISALFIDSTEKLWIGTSDAGISYYDRENDTFKSYKNSVYNSRSLSHNRILAITEDKNGRIWIGTGNGLNIFNPEENQFTRYKNSRDIPDSLAGNIVYSLYQDRSGALWVGTNQGLDRYDPQEDAFIHHKYQPNVPNSLSNNEIQTIYEDASGVLWIGTYGGGLNKYNRQQDRYAYFRHNPDDPSSLSSNFIFAILADARNQIWVGTFDNGLNLFSPRLEKFTRYKHNPNDPTSLSDDSIISLYSDSEGVMWIGTGSALDRYNRGTNDFSHFTPEQSSFNDPVRFAVFAILEDSFGTFWIGSNRGLMQFDKRTKQFTEYKTGNPDTEYISNSRVNVLLEDEDKNLWVGTYDDGLLRIRLETGEISHYRHKPSDRSTLGSNTVMDIHQDANGNIWVGTHGGGLSLFNPKTGTFANFTENEGLSNNVVYGILEDEAGHLWMSTNFGLSKFDPARRTFRIFTSSDGLQSNEFNQNAFAKDRNGTMYFGGINGLNIFVPQDIKDNVYTPNIALTSITLDGITLETERATEYIESITLTWPQDSFEFEFASFAYEQPAKNQYAYMLEGFDTDWINIANQRNGRYTNLPGGTYTLRLRGSNSDGVWNDQGIAIQVIVVPPFWETWWFLSLLVIGFGVSVAGGLRWRVKNIQNRNRELERLVRNRTADLEKRTGEIEALYQADEKILRSVTLNQVFQTLVDVSVSILKAERSVVFAWNEEKHKVMPRVSRGFSPKSLAALTFDRDEGMIGIAMNTGTAVIASDLTRKSLREDVLTVIKNENIESFAHFPIVVDGRVVAIFNVAYTRPNALTKDSVRLFTALVNRAALSIANMELFEQTKDLAVMEERNRLARDLHDSAKQKAFAALAQLGTVNGMAKTSIPREISPHLSEAETLIYEVIQELNFLIQEIYPIALQEKGLQTTLREYVFEWENRNDATVNLTIQNERELPLEMEQAVYRVIQEALANIARHSKAKRAGISLVYNHEVLQVVIADDGCGFDMNQKAKGMGFRSMRERISSIHGTLQIQSAPGQGTRLIIQIPTRNGAGG
ncbi:MAG TPA: two-component regulator propeller domain-containing protein [Anaerolineales bacterium]|mgnify:FL=1|nr:two-component regulator propeller domain-containing protein [Anaerolineales bacterium]